MTCSVLINNFNNAPYLRACIDSVLQQTLPPDEILIYDDGSTDESPEIIRSYGSKVKGLLAPKLSLNKRQNQIHAINKAFEACNGEFVFLLDGDDAFLPGKLAAYVEAFSNPAVVMVQGPLALIDREGQPLGEFYHDWVHGIDIRERISATRDLDFFYPTSALGFRRSFLEKAMPIETRKYRLIGADSALHILAVLHGDVVTLDQPQTLYRQHNTNMSGRFRKPMYRALFDKKLNEYYNDHARLLGREPLSLWRNRRFVRRTGRQVLDLISRRA